MLKSLQKPLNKSSRIFVLENASTSGHLSSLLSCKLRRAHLGAALVPVISSEDGNRTHQMTLKMEPEKHQEKIIKLGDALFPHETGTRAQMMLALVDIGQLERRFADEIVPREPMPLTFTPSCTKMHQDL